jgi:hypothetical protein
MSLSDLVQAALSRPSVSPSERAVRKPDSEARSRDDARPSLIVSLGIPEDLAGRLAQADERAKVMAFARMAASSLDGAGDASYDEGALWEPTKPVVPLRAALEGGIDLDGQSFPLPEDVDLSAVSPGREAITLAPALRLSSSPLATAFLKGLREAYERRAESAEQQGATGLSPETALREANVVSEGLDRSRGLALMSSRSVLSQFSPASL